MTFDQRFEKAFFVSEHYFKKFSGLSGGFHPSYKPLFRKLWIQQDPNQTGSFTSLSQCENFARGMVDNKWSDWAPSEKDRKIWSALLAIHGKIEIEEFARVAEDEDYQIPEPALITPAHTAWKQQGGDNPGAPSSGQARFQTIDWSKPREQVSKEIHDALKKDGFFLLKNHGINPTLISSSLSNSREFFARRKFAKEEEIRQIAIQESMRPMMKCARGYSDIRTEALNPVQGPDVKETFDYSLQSSDSPSPSSSSSSSSSCMSKMHLGPNLWPSEITPVNVLSGPSIALAPSGFRDKCEEYQSAVYKLSMELLQIICEGVELSKEQINQEIMPMFQDPLVVSRLIHYPPQGRFATPKTPSYNRYQPFPSLSRYPEPQQQQQQQQDPEMGAGSHVDYGALTLIAEDCAGLEVQRRGSLDNPWEDVPHVEGAFVVNTGYVLEKLTNGRLPATRHRVQNKNAMDRYSLALFLDPNPESIVKPLEALMKEGEKPKYEQCVAGHKGVRFGNPKYLELAAARA